MPCYQGTGLGCPVALLAGFPSKAADASKQRNLMVVGVHSDNAVDLCGEDNADAKRQCLGKGQTMPTKPPSQYGETRYGSRVTMSERMINTKRI